MNRLQRTVPNKVPIIVDIHRRNVRSLVEKLISNKTVKVVHRYVSSLAIKLEDNVVKIEGAPRRVILKKKTLKHFIKDISGMYVTVYLSTTDGIRTHEEALEAGVGGVVLGYSQTQ